MEKDMWGAIAIHEWKETPFIEKRPATEEDIEKGFAVFAIPTGSSAHSIELPHCLIQFEEGTGKRIPGIAIQAEEANGDVYLGIRYISGGNGVCTIGEVEFLSEPNSEFDL
jgi:hypothetical protein